MTNENTLTTTDVAAEMAAAMLMEIKSMMDNKPSDADNHHELGMSIGEEFNLDTVMDDEFRTSFDKVIGNYTKIIDNHDIENITTTYTDDQKSVKVQWHWT